jgi:hypothetical protein
VSNGVFGAAIALLSEPARKNGSRFWPPRSGSRLSAATLRTEPIGKEFPECGESDKDRYKEKCDDHLDDGEIHGVACNEITRDGRGKDHYGTYDQVQHVNTNQRLWQRFKLLVAEET